MKKVIYIIIIFLGILILVQNSFLLIVGILEFFVSKQLKLWEFVGTISFIVLETLLMFFVVRYLLFQRIYKVCFIGKSMLSVETQFKSTIIHKKDILNIDLGYSGRYRLKVRCNERNKSYWLKYENGKKVVQWLR